jgi:hypothetical protein
MYNYMVYRRNPGVAPITASHRGMLAANRANAQKSTGPRHGRGQGWSGFERPPARRSHLAAGRKSFLGRAGRRRSGKPIPQRPRQGARPKPGVLTIKAGMSFFFMGIMLATPPSIKDSGCDPRGGTARPHPQRKRRCGTTWDQAGAVAEGVEAKAGKCNRNVIVLSRFHWLEQCRGRQRFRSHRPSR